MVIGVVVKKVIKVYKISQVGPVLNQWNQVSWTGLLNEVYRGKHTLIHFACSASSTHGTWR